MEVALPRTRLEAIALHEHYTGLERAGNREILALNVRAGNLSSWSKLDVGEQRWIRLVHQAIVHSHFEPELWSAYKAAWDSHDAFLDAASRYARIKTEMVERATGTCEQRAAVYDAAARAYMEGLRPFVRGHTDSVCFV